MAHKLTASVLGLAVVGVLLASPVSTAPATSQAEPGLTRTVFASVVARDGTPVTDLTAADFEVKEGGKVQAPTSVRPTTMPLRVHIIVSDAGTGAFQLGVLRMIQSLGAGPVEFAITTVLVQSQRILDFTSNPELVSAALGKIGRRGTATGGHQMMEAISSAVKDIAAPGKHPVLVVLRVGNEEASTIPATPIREAIRMSGATMFVVSRAGASRAAPTYAGGGSMTPEAAARQMDDTELADTALNLNLVLGDGSKESGGYQQEIPLTTAAPALEQLASQIKGSYEIVYTLPAGTKPSDRLQVTTKRRNVTIRAPQKIAN
jgi:hypothetical protein